MAQPAAHPLPSSTQLRAVQDAVDADAAFTARAQAVGIDVSGPLSSGPRHVDLASYRVTLDGGLVSLSPRQVELLALFLGAPRRVWSREQLHAICWGDTAPSRRVDVQLCRLRAKTGIDLFRNVRDRGWAMRDL